MIINTGKLPILVKILALRRMIKLLPWRLISRVKLLTMIQQAKKQVPNGQAENNQVYEKYRIITLELEK